MNYEESVAYLEQAASFGIKPGLERIEAMLKKLGNPETAYKVIHVTGTNGKGSVVAMITSVLENAQLRVGRYISPHLLDYTERIYICGHDISREDFAKAATVVRKAAEEIIADGVEAPTEFELLTAWLSGISKNRKWITQLWKWAWADFMIRPMSFFRWFLSLPMWLWTHEVPGNTLQEIAHQKAGIIKEGIPVVTAAQHVALKQLKKEAHEKKSRIYFYGRDFEIDSRNPWKHGQVVTVKRKDMPKELEKSLLFVPFVGAHQAVNAAVATMALSIIMKQDDRVNENDLREGLARTRWQGRFEIHDVKGVTYIMDGAHNPAGAEAYGSAGGTVSR